MNKKRPIVIDMFAGAGGESQGIHWASQKEGVDIELFAINHWEQAVETHSLNFPADNSICKDIDDVNPLKVVPGRHVELLWASPACTHFSTARGGKPMDEQSRVTPFTVCNWIEKLDVKRVIIENVPEFQSWCPLDSNFRPIKSAKGDTFNAFINMIRSFGYVVDWRVLNSADFGAPTTRRRLFIQAVKKGSGKEIIWEQPTHVRPEDESVFSEGRPSWVSAKDIIDWSLKSIPIENRTRPLAANTMKRIMQGIERYWGDGAKPFITRYNGGENRNHSISDPVPSLDTSNRYGLVEPFTFSFSQTGSNRRVRPISEPISTIVTKAEQCLVEPLFIPQHSCGTVKPTRNPLSTVTTTGAISIIEPLLMEYYGNGQCKPTTSPVGTITTKDRFALLEPKNVSIGFRMLQPHELSLAQSFPSTYRFTGNKGDVVKQIGNAVPPKVAESLARSSFVGGVDR